MDRIDEWFGRAFEEKSLNQPSKKNPVTEKPKQRFSKFKKLIKRSKHPQKPQTARPSLLSSGKHKTVEDFEKASGRPLKKKATKQPQILRGKLKIIPLGGLNEVGKNMMALEYEEDIIVIDMGFEFPSEDMLGIDYVIPDVSWLEENKKRIRGIVITHGHLDHIGGIPYILPRLDFPPVFGTKLTMGLIQKRSEEFDQLRASKFYSIDPDKPLRLGKFLCNFFRVAHSIPDAVGVVVDTPAGKIVHTGDFKFEDNPVGGQKPQDLHKMEALGRQNVLALFSDSTNSLKPGHTMSEQKVGETLERAIKDVEGRLIIASFSSLIGRLQQVIDLAAKYNRKVFISGRSMSDNISIAARLGYMKLPKDTIFDIKKYKEGVPDKQALILTTGSQGEAFSALTRISNDSHAHIKIKKGDTVLISATPIVGNERSIHTVINSLSLKGANVIYSQIAEVHTSGHAYQEEMVQMINLVKPKYFIPIHGEYFMRQAHANLAINRCGIPADRAIMIQNGNVLVAEKDKTNQGRLYVSNEKVETKYILIDGLGEGHAGSQVLMERQIMAQNGLLIVLLYVSKKGHKLLRDPDVISRGYIYMHESEFVTAEISKLAQTAYHNIMAKNSGATRNDVKKYIRQTVDNFTEKNLERRPLIVPLIVEV